MEETGPVRPARQLQILIVEDNEDSREALSSLLTFAGHVTRMAHDGPSALAMVSDWSPDVVLLDIGLPGMDGHDLARRLREQTHLGDVVLVALTGWGQASDRQRSAAAGIDHHLIKPIDPSALEKLLGTLARAASGNRPSADGDLT